MFRFTKNYLLVGGFALLMASSKQVNAQKTKDKEKDKQEQTPSQPKIGTGIPSGTTLFPTKNSDDDWHMAAQKLQQTLRIVNNQYMDEVDPKKASEDAIKGLLEELDPHSVYISAEEYQKVNEPLVGNFEGIGVSFNIIKDTIVVLNTIGGGPSEKVGIMAGDKIVKIEGDNVAGIKITNDDVVKKLRGPKDTKVKVSMARQGEKELLDFVIIRDKIPLYSVEAAYMATPTVGYIKLNRFASTSVEEVGSAIEKLQTQNMQDLIFDLRGNGGGLLDASFKLSSMFFPEGRLIVYTEGRKSPRTDYQSVGEGIFRKGRLVVLIDEGSASASEIVSGAIQDWDRGLLIGRRSFGKGLVQRPFPLSDGSMIRLTVAHYYTPSGRCIQRPYDNGKDDYKKDLSKRYEDGELTGKKAEKEMPDSLKSYTLLKKRLVYGGGGVMPDIFVPIDTTLNYGFYNEMNRKNIINEFMLEYVNKNRSSLLLQYPNIEKFKETYTISDQLIEQLTETAKRDSVENKEPEKFKEALPTVKVLLKALMARYLWDAEAYVKVVNDINPVYLKALEALKDDTFKKLKIGNE